MADAIPNVVEDEIIEPDWGNLVADGINEHETRIDDLEAASVWVGTVAFVNPPGGEPTWTTAKALTLTATADGWQPLTIGGAYDGTYFQVTETAVYSLYAQVSYTTGSSATINLNVGGTNYGGDRIGVTTTLVVQIAGLLLTAGQQIKLMVGFGVAGKIDAGILQVHRTGVGP